MPFGTRRSLPSHEPGTGQYPLRCGIAGAPGTHHVAEHPLLLDPERHRLLRSEGPQVQLPVSDLGADVLQHQGAISPETLTEGEQLRAVDGHQDVRRGGR